ncbi:MAG TPA: helix-turn-helix domain-containing protein [Solirubrobacterales bacterium]|nr:helix-turn-helix domain-containing protein [Solirubrobacterales bacterium]
MASMIDAIADPVRARLVRRLASDGPGSLDELAAAAGVHPNTARAHLHAMEGEGLVESAPQPAGERGRPRTIFSLREGWALPDDGFRALAELLAATLGETQPNPRALRRLGARWGRRSLAGRTPDDAQAELLRMLGRLGFDARIENGRLELGACPCPLISPEQPALVCKLVDAVVDGILEGSGGHIRARRRRHDPAHRTCSALLQLEAA